MNKRPHKGFKKDSLKNIIYIEPIWIFRKSKKRKAQVQSTPVSRRADAKNPCTAMS